MSNLQEAASDEHQRLVGALIDQFITDGLEIVKAAYEGFEAIGRHEPDIIARDPQTEIISIGEAKTCSNLASERSQGQFEDFANRLMAIGRSENAVVPLHIIPPVRCAQAVWTVLGQLGLDSHSNITVWHY